VELEAIMRLTRSRRRRKRLEAVELLAGLPPAMSAPVLVEMLSDRRDDVAEASAEVLRMRAGAEGRAALAGALSGLWPASLIAARSLAHERDPRAFDLLVAALRGNDWDAWWPATESLCLYGGAAAPILERELLNEDGPRLVRELAASSLAEIAGRAAVPALVVAAGSSDRVVAGRAKSALIDLGEDPAVIPSS
jgi:HEAT repeat protein